MLIAPINGPEFSRACRIRSKSPAPCRLPQLLRLLALAALAGGLISLALSPGARAEIAPAAVSTSV
jgi:hypothetical protein